MAAVTVIGVGNRLRGDDAIGPLLIDALAHQDLGDIELIDAGSDALGILEYLEHRSSVLIVDACRMGKAPGSVICFRPAEAHLTLSKAQVSLHGLGLAETLQLAESLKMLPEDLKIIGIEPVSLQLSGELSQPVQQALKIAMDHVHEELLKSRCLAES